MNFRILLIIFSLIVIASVSYDNYYTTNIVSGSYSYEFPLAIPEGPSEGDNLLLLDNGDFKSDTSGSGTYKIDGSRITFFTSEIGFQTNLYRPFFWGKPRISISSGLDYYFKQK